MYLIVGLGNPTAKYEKTRHNAGFDVIDAIADKYGIELNLRKGKAFCNNIFDTVVSARTSFFPDPQIARDQTDIVKNNNQIFHRIQLVKIHQGTDTVTTEVHIRLRFCPG